MCGTDASEFMVRKGDDAGVWYCHTLPDMHG
jgi:hypothetical protein